MPAARPETLIMREARAIARDDRLRVTTTHYPDGRLTVGLCKVSADSMA